MSRALFLGGPGNISESTIERLLGGGWEVAVLKRSEGGLLGLDVQLFLGDRDDEATLTHALTSFRPDLVVDCTCFTTEQAETVTRALTAHPVARLVFISTADVYGYPLSRLPMREQDPWRPPTSEYAASKKAIEELYQRACEETGTRLTIVRPGYSMGKSFALTAFSLKATGLVARLRQGRPVFSPGDGTTLIDAGAARNTGLMVARLCEVEPRELAYNCAHNGTVTYDEYLRVFGEAVGVEPSIVHIPTDVLYALERPEVEQSLLRDLTSHHLYFAVDRFREEFPDFRWEHSLVDAARDHIAHQESLGAFDAPIPPGFEDRVVDAWVAGFDDLRSGLLSQV
ncbi:NAD-dependent epimerase/dehydratase family protein [Arachnia propionica]|uniref:NAD-dependent epimerase/dehydratase family protein n=1 Tax=Arachnia propionica TaxID=1750 RepID=UPI00163B1F9A|nr:NAD-dependent epimerase/dehydratase family protein [Arachnia propionica]